MPVDETDGSGDSIQFDSTSHGAADDYEIRVARLLRDEVHEKHPDAKITFHRKKRYHGLSGNDHEIDVSLELDLAGFELKLLAECKRRSKRKIMKRDVQAFSRTLDDIGGAKGVVVTTIGFDEGARREAESKGIALAILSENADALAVVLKIIIPAAVIGSTVVRHAKASQLTLQDMGHTVLVVEDESLLSMIVAKVLGDAGYDTRWTDASTMAWEYLDKSVCASSIGTDIIWEPVGRGGYGLVVLDVDRIRREPYELTQQGEGLRLIKRLRNDRRFSAASLPVIGITHHLPPYATSWEDDFLRAGGNVFFEWPIDLQEMVNAVSRLIGPP